MTEQQVKKGHFQCDLIGLFLKDFRYKYAYISISNKYLAATFWPF